MPAISSNLPVYEDKEMAWDASAAMDRWKTECMDSDGNMDFSKFKKMFLWVDPDKADMMGGYKLPFADVTGGTLKAVFKGVASAMGALNGARGGVMIPDGDKSAVYTQIKKYYTKFGEKVPELKSLVIEREVGEHVSVHAMIDSATVKDLGDDMLEAVVSTNLTDYHGESIDIGGVDVSQYHGTVLYGHDYEGLPIGKATKVTKFANKIKAQFKMATELYPFAKTVYNMIKEGYLTDVSIGGLVTEWSNDYTTIKGMIMKEFSVVPVGANNDAMISMKSMGKSMQEVQKEYRDFISRSVIDKAKTIPDNELQETIKNLEQLLKHLKSARDELESSNKGESGEVQKVKLFTLKKAAQQINTESAKAIKIIKLKEL